MRYPTGLINSSQTNDSGWLEHISIMSPICKMTWSTGEWSRSWWLDLVSRQQPRNRPRHQLSTTIPYVQFHFPTIRLVYFNNRVLSLLKWRSLKYSKQIHEESYNNHLISELFSSVFLILIFSPTVIFCNEVSFVLNNTHV